MSAGTARNPSPPSRQRKLGRLHYLKRQLGLDDEAYRAKLELATGKRSSSELDDAGIDRALDAFSMFHGKPVKRETHAYLRKIKALWISAWNLGALETGTDAALDAFVKRQTGRERLRFVGPDEASRVTEALKEICEREGFYVPSIDPDGRASRRALLGAQWRKLNRQGKVHIGDTAALDAYVTRRYLKFTGSTVHLSKDQLDDCAKHLGRWLRAPRR